MDEIDKIIGTKKKHFCIRQNVKEQDLHLVFL